MRDRHDLRLTGMVVARQSSFNIERIIVLLHRQVDIVKHPISRLADPALNQLFLVEVQDLHFAGLVLDRPVALKRVEL